MKYGSIAEKNADALIRRANTQLRAAAKEFGLQSKEYEKMESKIIHAFSGDYDRYLRKDPATGATQVKRSRENLAAVAARPDGRHRGAEGKAVEQIDKKMSVQDIKKRLLGDYERRTGKKPKTAEEKRQAVREQRGFVSSVSSEFNSNLKQLYDIEQALGYPLMAIARIRMISQGAATPPEDLQAMNEIAKEAIRQYENGEPIDVDPGILSEV